MKESNFGNKFIDEHLRLKYPLMWDLKVHGHEMQASDVPDNLFCINSLFVAIEFKVQRDGRIITSPGQIREINKIKNAGGIGLFVAFDENRGKILIRERRLDYQKLFFQDKAPTAKKKAIKVDWDFEYNSYEHAVDLINLLIQNKGEI